MSDVTQFKYRADHVGSFLRPAKLLAARLDPSTRLERLRELEDECILEVIEKQRSLGFKIFTDGELRRRSFMSDFNESVEGLDEGDAVGRDWTGTGAAPVSRNLGIAVGKIRARRRLAKHEFDFLKAHSPGDTKITLPSANQFPAIAFKKGITDKVYATYSEFLWDIVPVIKAEIAALTDEGVNYIQIDAPRYSYYIDPKWRAYIKDEMGLDPDQAMEEAIRADNECISAAKGNGPIVCVHLCRGNNRSQWFAEGGYDEIADKLFNGLEADAFSLEYDDERSGSFQPLQYLPHSKVAILGLISSKVSTLEKQEDILDRIKEASRYAPLENLALQPQCGFASMMEGNVLSEDDQWRKLELVAETARIVWDD